MSNRPARSQAISGLRVTGVMAMMSGIIIGCRAPGLHRRQLVSFGPRPGGVGTTAFTPSTKVTGAQQSVFTGVLITATATPAMVTGAADGVGTLSSTTPL